MYEKVPTNLDFVAREKAIEKFWKEHDIFEKSIDSRKTAQPILSTTARPRRMESRISAMWKHAALRI